MRSRWTLVGALAAAVVLVAGCAPPPQTAPRAVEVHTEYGRSCALLEDGTVRCWGGGFTGDGSTGTLAPLPVEVTGLDDAVRSEEHTSELQSREKLEYRLLRERTKRP